MLSAYWNEILKLHFWLYLAVHKKIGPDASGRCELPLAFGISPFLTYRALIFRVMKLRPRTTLW